LREQEDARVGGLSFRKQSSTNGGEIVRSETKKKHVTPRLYWGRDRRRIFGRAEGKANELPQEDCEIHVTIRTGGEHSEVVGQGKRSLEARQDLR